MKILVVLTLLVASISYSHQNEVLLKAAHRFFSHTTQIINECVKETGTPKELLDEYEHFGEMINDERFRCFLFCTCLKSGYIDDKGIIAINVVAETLEITDERALKDIEAKCKYPKSEDKCNASQETILCVIDVLTIYKY